MGRNNGEINNCYSIAAISGDNAVGGIVGVNENFDTSRGDPHGDIFYPKVNISRCYSVGTINGTSNIGGLVGFNDVNRETRRGYCIVEDSFWDIEISGINNISGNQVDDVSCFEGSLGKTTAEMQTASTFLDADWDFVDEVENGPNDIWKISEGFDYPRLWWEKYGGGTGEPNNPYLIYTTEHLNEMSAEANDWDKHFKLMADIDLSEYSYDRAVIAPDIDAERGFQGTTFNGVFDGNGNTISHLTIEGDNHLGLFGRLEDGAIVSNLGLAALYINGTGDYIGSFAGINIGNIIASYSNGTIKGDNYIGGLVGYNNGMIITCYNNCRVSGTSCVGGLVGENYYHYYIFFYAEYGSSRVHGCYSTGLVTGNIHVGGLVGNSIEYIDVEPETHTFGWQPDVVTGCFWDIETSSQTRSAYGTGLTTNEMQAASTFIEAGWNFVDEAVNEIDTITIWWIDESNIWWIDEGKDYPRLWWELSLSVDHPDYDEWVGVGEPACWCYKRQCHGDTDGKPQSEQQYWVSTDDLDVLIAAWNKPFAEIDGRTVNGVPLICADFDHKAQGKENYRVSTDDLDILIANWNQANAPAADCP